MSKQYLVTVPDNSILANTTNALIFDAPATERECRRMKTNMGLISHDDLDRELKASREAGRDEAWELIARINDMPTPDRWEAFGTSWIDEIVKHGCEEAAKQYTAWTKKKAEETKLDSVGDIIELPSGEKRIVVNRDPYGVYTLTKEGKVMILSPSLINWKKTGKHVDILGVLEKLTEI